VSRRVKPNRQEPPGIECENSTIANHKATQEDCKVCESLPRLRSPDRECNKMLLCLTWRKSRALADLVALDPRSRGDHEKSGKDEREKLFE
jgi:hypothetical protein